MKVYYNFFYYTQKGSVEVLKTMFEVDKLLVTNAVNRFNENTPLHLATEGGHLEAVKLMLLNGVAPNDENKTGLTPVHLGGSYLLIPIPNSRASPYRL